MARRRLPAGRVGGGEEIQAPRPRSARLATAVCSFAAGVGVVVLGTVQAPEHELPLVAVGGAGLLLLGVGLATRWSAALALAVLVLGAEQALRLAFGSSQIDAWTPAYAAGLLLVAELAWWSVEPRVAAWSEAAVVLRRVGAIVALCAAGAIVAALIVIAAGAPLHGGVSLELVGVLAAVGAVAVVAGLARGRVG